MTDNPTPKRDRLIFDSWWRRFELLDQIDGEYWTRASELELRDRLKLLFRFWAFLFGPFYYFAKGMWAKGLCILTLFVLTRIVIWPIVMEMALSIESTTDSLPSILHACLFGLLCAVMATVDYYRKMVHNERMWPIVSRFLPAWVTSIPMLLVVLVGSLIVYGIATNNHGYGWWSCKDSTVSSAVIDQYYENFAVDGDEVKGFVQSAEHFRGKGYVACMAGITVLEQNPLGSAPSSRTFFIQYDVDFKGFLGLEKPMVELINVERSDSSYIREIQKGRFKDLTPNE